MGSIGRYKRKLVGGKQYRSEINHELHSMQRRLNANGAPTVTATPFIDRPSGTRAPQGRMPEAAGGTLIDMVQWVARRLGIRGVGGA